MKSSGHVQGPTGVEFMAQLVASDPEIMMGKPVIAGTRITVESILERLGAGESIEEIVDSHPRLSREAVLAAISFAAEALKADVVYPAPTEVA
jgi:uncharacterized protein (DUF433 family)